MIVNAAFRNLIRENKLFQIPSLMQAGRAEGMQTFEMAAKDLVARREISVEQAIQLTNNPKLFDGDDPADGDAVGSSSSSGPEGARA